jgi:hypothetical protein
VVAVVVKTERLVPPVVVTLYQCREVDVKEEQRVAIKFCCKVDFSATKTVELIQKAYGDAALSRTTIEWYKRCTCNVALGVFAVRRLSAGLYGVATQEIGI